MKKTLVILLGLAAFSTGAFASDPYLKCAGEKDGKQVVVSIYENEPGSDAASFAPFNAGVTIDGEVVFLRNIINFDTSNKNYHDSHAFNLSDTNQESSSLYLDTTWTGENPNFPVKNPVVLNTLKVRCE